MKWFWNRTANVGGRFKIQVQKLVPTTVSTDLGQFRGQFTEVTYSSSDPFGDSTATLRFPGVTALDDPDCAELIDWLGNYANVDIYWTPGVPFDDKYAKTLKPWINPLTQDIDIFTPGFERDAQGKIRYDQPLFIKVWEGYVASMEYTAAEQGHSLEVQCQGALFQLDHYLQKPFYPSRPYPMEALIKDVFSHKQKPHLRTQPLQIVFPAGWKRKAPKYTGGSANVYSPVVKPGDPWTGYTTRNTGSWEHALTGFVQDQLSLMLTDDASGVTPGNQWTVAHQHNQNNRAGRQPVLMVRDRFRAPDFSLWIGQPGLAASLAGDATQSANIIYGDGTDISGETWRNAVISGDGSRTDYLPLAASRLIYPPHDNPAFNKGAFASEAYTKFGSGFAQKDATTVAKQQLGRDQEPGWSGTLTLRTDPSGMSRWLIRAGMTVKVKGFLGTGEAGLNFHIASVQADPQQGTVEMTIDTRYRDLLTVGEAQARTRDPLNPVRMLQVNKTSVLIEDIQAPWDYTAGSGYVPLASKNFYFHAPSDQSFPLSQWAGQHQPLHYPQYYVKIKANAAKSADRWAGPIPILTAEKYTIARTEFFCVDVYGRRLRVPFHVSIYAFEVGVRDMPRSGNNISPYINGAFETVNPATGQPWDKGNFLAPNDAFIIGWGNKARGILNRAGFSPGSEAAGDNPTGLLADDSTWNWDNTGNKDYQLYAKPGKEPRSAITNYAMFYCEYTKPVYITGRLYRQNPGVN